MEKFIKKSKGFSRNYLTAKQMFDTIILISKLEIGVGLNE